MGDYGWAHICIGGALTPEQRDGLREALEDEGLTIDFTLGLEEAVRRADAHRQYDVEVDEEGHLAFTDQGAPGAMFADLEARLIALGIPFDRDSGHAGEFGDMLAYWRPGMAAKVDAVSDEGNSDVYVPVGEVREHLAAGDLPAWLDGAYPVPTPLPSLVLP